MRHPAGRLVHPGRMRRLRTRSRLLRGWRCSRLRWSVRLRRAPRLCRAAHLLLRLQDRRLGPPWPPSRLAWTAWVALRRVSRGILLPGLRPDDTRSPTPATGESPIPTAAAADRWPVAYNCAMIRLPHTSPRPAMPEAREIELQDLLSWAVMVVRDNAAIEDAGSSPGR